MHYCNADRKSLSRKLKQRYQHLVRNFTDNIKQLILTQSQWNYIN